MARCNSCFRLHGGTGDKCAACKFEDSGRLTDLEGKANFKAFLTLSRSKGGDNGGTPVQNDPRSPLTIIRPEKQVVCKFAYGCPWTGPIRELDAHRKECH
jgi:hypothetical protein